MVEPNAITPQFVQSISKSRKNLEISNNLIETAVIMLWHVAYHSLKSRMIPSVKSIVITPASVPITIERLITSCLVRPYQPDTCPGPMTFSNGQ